MTIYFSSRSGGPCWTRELGYHTPAPLPAHIKRIITQRRDSDGSPEGRDGDRLDGEAATARAEGIAETLSEDTTHDHS